MNDGETPLEAALRETKEETGVDKSDIECYENFEEKITYDVQGKPKNVYYYLGRLRDIQQTIRLSDEHQALAWLNLQDACNVVKHENFQFILQKVQEFLLKQKES